MEISVVSESDSSVKTTEDITYCYLGILLEMYFGQDLNVCDFRYNTSNLIRLSANAIFLIALLKQ